MKTGEELSMATTLLNTDRALEILKAQMNKEMIEAGKPIIEKALSDIESVMRKKLGSMIVAYLDNYMEIERKGDVLRILIKHET